MSSTNLKIYLCGSIKKGDDDNIKRLFWGPEEENEILKCFGDNYTINLLNPASIGLKRSDSFANFGGDIYLVKSSDFIFVDARDRRGIGIGGEMITAKYYNIPVISLCPVGSHYRKSHVNNLCGENVKDWIHPFIYGLSDYISDDIPMAIEWMKRFKNNPMKIKGIEVLEESISYFLDKQSINQM